MATAETLRKLCADELRQLDEEGCRVQALQAEYDRLAEDPDTPPQAWRALLDQAAKLQPAADFPFEEPSKLEAIRAARPDGPRRLHRPPDLQQRLLGAWLGRCAGCMLGKPVEGRSRDQIEAILKAAGEYPLTDYFPALPQVPDGVPYRPPTDPCLRPNITHSVRDDDTDYTILGLHILETHGPDFTSRQVADTWLGRLPFHLVYTAERAAYRNLVNEVWPPESARVDNPYREWIGAQIRCDGFAYCAAGWPQKAAEFAFRDAAVSHVKNGIYGEMFFAALIAAVLAGQELEAAIATGLSEIPARCRLAEAVSDVLQWCAEDTDWPLTWDKIMAKYGHYHPVHTINNAALVLMGLLHANGDFGRAICIAVMGGLDTDCNGATAGSVIGGLLGADQLPDQWTAPLNDRLDSIIAGMGQNRITDLAERTAAMVEHVWSG